MLFSSHVCHPSLANDNLSGVAVAVELIRWLQQRPQRRYTYRFVFAPGTIGALVWLSRNRETLARIRAGLVLTLLGDAGPSTYKKTRCGNTEVDRAAAQVLETAGSPHTIREFSPTGYDERQYGSPGFDLPVGCLMRTPHAEYPEYHTSADDLSLVRPASLADSWQKAAAIVDLLERNVRYRNEFPYGEPQLGRRGVFAALSARADKQQVQPAIPWVLNLSDGQHSLLDIAERSKLNFWQVAGAADLLAGQGLLTRVADGRA
jgi:aminopeptidase-like protein